MKKFLLPILLAFVILIPTLEAQAADVPSFSRVAGNYVPFKTKEIWRKKDGRTYYYECSVDLRGNFAEQYINLLKKCGITYIGHESKDFRRTSAQYIDKWFFSYRGKKIVFWNYRYFAEGRMTFSVHVPNGLTYEGD